MAIGKLVEGCSIAGRSSQYAAIYSDNDSQEKSGELEEDEEHSEPEDQSDASYDPDVSKVSAEQFFTTTTGISG